MKIGKIESIKNDKAAHNILNNSTGDGHKDAKQLYSGCSRTQRTPVNMAASHMLT